MQIRGQLFFLDFYLENTDNIMRQVLFQIRGFFRNSHAGPMRGAVFQRTVNRGAVIRTIISRLTVRDRDGIEINVNALGPSVF